MWLFYSLCTGQLACNHRSSLQVTSNLPATARFNVYLTHYYNCSPSSPDNKFPHLPNKIFIALAIIGKEEVKQMQMNLLKGLSMATQRNFEEESSHWTGSCTWISRRSAKHEVCLLRGHLESGRVHLLGSFVEEKKKSKPWKTTH